MQGFYFTQLSCLGANVYIFLFTSFSLYQDNHFTGSQNGRLLVTQDGTLQIAGVESNDAGHYICQAIGGEGVARARANLKVIREYFVDFIIPQYFASF